MEVADVDALALVGGGLLVEAVPVTRACATHELFSSSFLAKSLAKFTSSRLLLGRIAHIYRVFSKCEGGGLPPHTPFPVSSDVPVHAPGFLLM
jgi:hypothetical protein